MTSLSLSCVGEGNGNPLQCSCLENPRDGGAWWASVYGVAQSRRQLKWLSSSNSSSSNISSQCEVYPDVPQSLNISFLLTNNKFLLLIYLEKGKWGVFPPTYSCCIICTVLQNEAKSTWHLLETVGCNCRYAAFMEKDHVFRRLLCSKLFGMFWGKEGCSSRPESKWQSLADEMC